MSESIPNPAPALRPISARLDADLVERVRAFVRASPNYTVASFMSEGFALALERAEQNPASQANGPAVLE